MSGLQLTMDGREEQVRTGHATSAGFTPAQREILKLIATYGTVTSMAAGKIVHAHREPRCKRCADSGLVNTCPYASSDGGDALKRLKERGVVRRVAPGRWTGAR